MVQLASAVTALLSGVLVAACAAEPLVGSGPLRLLVKLAQPSDDAAQIARFASQGAGVSARYLAATSGLWHAVVIECNSPRECNAALERLRADRTHFEAVERDERKRIVTP